MNLHYQIIEQADGSFAYKVFKDGVPWIVQPYKPGVEGKVPMTEAEAIAHAEQDIADNTPATEPQDEQGP
jgi:hypothetical protein